jgi:hypothetical protein
MSDIPAMNFRSKFIREINYKSTSTDSAISIYARYKQIPYGQRIDQQGMTWSQDAEEVECSVNGQIKADDKIKLSIRCR